MEDGGSQEKGEEDFENEDYIDETEEFYDDSDEFLDEEDYGGSEPKPLGGIYGLFDTVLNKPRSTKVSNLDKEELGSLGISVRDCGRIALLGKTFGHKKFANFFMSQAGIISDSSMSKGGWFTELFVTSKRYASRDSSSSVKELPQYNKKKWKMFSAKGKESQQR